MHHDIHQPLELIDISKKTRPGKVLYTMHDSPYPALILFFILTLVAEILGTIGGFGSSLFFVSLSQFFYDFKIVLALRITLTNGCLSISPL